MATAIYARSESGDSYLYCVEKTLTTETDVQAYLKRELGDEYNYISDIDVVHSDEGK